MGLIGDRLKVQVHAPPVGGEANHAVSVLLAELAAIPVSRVRVVAGAKDRSKTVLLECDEPRDVVRRLKSALNDLMPVGDPGPAR